MYRVHDLPSPEKLEALREVLESLGLHLPKGGRVTPAQFNRVLARAPPNCPRRAWSAR